MSPTNGASGHRSTGSISQASRRVMPAIPLPYVKRQAAAAAAAAAAKDVGNISSTAESGHSSPTVGSDHKSEQDAILASTPKPTSSQKVNGTNGTSSTDSSVATRHEIPSPNTTSSSLSASTNTAAVTELPQAVAGDSSKVKDTPTKSETLVNGAHNERQAETRSQSSSSGGPSTQQAGSNTSSRYQMPPPFQPSARPNGLNGSGDTSHQHAHHVSSGSFRMHQNHPSNGGLHFGTFRDSGSSSPAPPHSGGPPPPGMQAPNGLPPFMGPPGYGPPPGFSHNDMSGSIDVYGRPFPPPDAYPPHGNFPPSTPHSFHDSQSSPHPDDHNMPPHHFSHRRHATGSGPDMPHNYRERMQDQRYAGAVPQHGPPRGMMSMDEDQSSLNDYVRRHFADPQYADCTLELRDARNGVKMVTIPAHRLILSRSPLLGLAVKDNPTAPNTVVFEVDDPWIGADSFWMAVQRLYGHPLLPFPTGPSRDAEGITDAGSDAHRFQFALSYAASGHSIGWDPVAQRGSEIGAQLLSIETIETAMKFCMKGFRDTATYEDYTYGDGARIILHAIVNFLANNLSPGFRFDPSPSGDTSAYARLPLDPAVAAPPDQNQDSPVVARGDSTRHLRNGSRSQAQSNIQFGDLSVSGQRNGSLEGVHNHSVLFSRILLNLPFTFLKMLLDICSYSEFVCHIVADVVMERERRRTRALDAIVNGTVADAEAIKGRLARAEPRSADKWNSLAWKEELAAGSSNDNGQRPYLVRQWAPLRLKQQQNGNVPQYP